MAWKWTISKLLATWLVLTVCAAAGEPSRFEAVESHMGTLVRIQLYAADERQAAAAFRAAFDRIAQLDQSLSDYKPDSELNRICGIAVRHPVEVSADLFRVLWASQTLAEETSGAFDVTLGPVTRLWRRARKEGRLPEEADLQGAGRRCGYRKLHLDPTKRTVSLDQEGMQLDPGGIAKGDAADAALEMLGRIGIHRALVAMSGDLAIGDPPPGRRGWKISAQDRILELANAAVSTSGDTEQHVDSAGERYSHIIDPATHIGLTSRMTVTVVARRGIDADGLSTAISVLGPERGFKLIERHPDAAALLTIDGRALVSSRWKK